VRVLFDSSALLKRYLAEPGSPLVLALAERVSELCVAAHCKAELSSALNRQRHDGLLEDADYRRTWAEVCADFDVFTVVAFSGRVETAAVTAMERVRLRAMDALHVATAQAASVELFVTADQRQARAADAMGLKTQLIEA
jgi:predicted nucleic acid-binding protein